MRDTPRLIDDKYREMLLRLSPAERLAMACRMFDTARALAGAGIRQERGSVETPSYVHRQMFLRFYRNDFSGDEVEKILHSIAGKGTKHSAPKK
jgi:hypothetical protein